MSQSRWFTGGTRAEDSAGGRVKGSLTHFDVRRSNAKQVQQSILNVCLGHVLSYLRRQERQDGDGINLSRGRGICASIVGIKGESVIDCRRCDLEFLDS